MKQLLVILLTVFLSTSVFAQEVCEQVTDFEIWQEGSGIRNEWKSWKQAEEHYFACKETVSFLGDIIAHLQGVPQQPIAEMPKCSGKWRNGNVFRPKSNRNAPVVVLQRKYCFEDVSITNDMKPLNIYITDTAGNKKDSGTFRYCHLANDGRLHHDFPRSANIKGPIQILLEFEGGKTECFDVPDSSREYK